MFCNDAKSRCSPICGLIIMLAVFAASEAAAAQVSPPSWTASPDVYKVVAENGQYRVVEATWKPGQRDQFHSHPNGGLFYAVTECSLRFHRADGSTSDVHQLAGAAAPQPAYDSHWVENVGQEACRMVVFEPK